MGFGGSSVHNDKLYGDEYRWDRCGTLSPKCQQHFVDEACFYECDHHAGKFRMHADCEDGDNGWQVRGTSLPAQVLTLLHGQCVRYLRIGCAVAGHDEMLSCAK